MPKSLIEPCRRQPGSPGNCQHIIEEDGGLWIIPSGTHYFFGHTVSDSSRSDSAATESRKDDVANELRGIVNDSLGKMGIHRAVDFSPLLQALVIYIVARDDKVLEHGRRLGQMESKQ